MAHTRIKSPLPLNIGMSLVAVVLFAVTGLQVAHTTFAATSNPYGSADYCALENNTTVIYGWAADPDAVSLAQPMVTLNVGNATVTAQTNRANYRDAAVAAWIDYNRTGDPKPGTYGFRVAIPGLTKGNKYPISGTVLNEGPGANVILSINNSVNIDGDKTKPFFANNMVPDSCLADPANPAPQTTSATPALTTQKTAASDVTGTTVTTGTTAAQLVVTTPNTATVHLIYGTDPLQLNQTSPDQLTTGQQTTIALTGLKAATRYSYRVVRTDLTGKQTTSPLDTFDTLGFVAAIHFVDSDDNGIQGIIGKLDSLNTTKTSDDTGTVQFTGISGGSHTVSFSYLGQTYSKPFTADASGVAPTIANAPQVITLDNAIDIQALIAKANTPAPKRTTSTALIALVIALMAVIILGIAIGFLIHTMRRRKELAAMAEEAPAPPLPEYKPLDPNLPPVVPVPPGADHMGESIKDLVIKDYHHGPKDNPPGTPD